MPRNKPKKKPSNKPKIIIAGLGPAGANLRSPEVQKAIESAPCRFLAGSCPKENRDLSDFDFVSTDENNPGLSLGNVFETLFDAAQKHGEVLFCTGGSPFVLEPEVEAILGNPRRDEAEVEILPGISFVDIAKSRLRVLTGEFQDTPALLGGKLGGKLHGNLSKKDIQDNLMSQRSFLIANCRDPEELFEVLLSAVESATDTAKKAKPEMPEIYALQHLGFEDEVVCKLEAKSDFPIDVRNDKNISFCVISPSATSFEREMREIARFSGLVAHLRKECPWDQQQDHMSLRRHLLEEAYEVLEAIDLLDDKAESHEALCDELGDLLYQVFFHALLASESNQFTLADVVENIHEKLYRRHPHVFGDLTIDSTEELAPHWEEIKRKEKDTESVMDGLNEALPALLYASKVQKKITALGLHKAGDASGGGTGGGTGGGASDGASGGEIAPLDLPENVSEALEQIKTSLESISNNQEPEEASAEESIGEMLWAICALSRCLSVDSEDALRAVARGFKVSAKKIEKQAKTI